jgi:endoglucanase
MRRHGIGRWTVLALIAASLAASSSWSAGNPTIAVSGNQLVDGAGHVVQLRGVNRAAFESRCTYDAGFADGPVDQPSVSAMRAWGINAVRLTLNPDCWLGVNGLPVGGDVSGYRQAVASYISLLERNGMYVIPVVEVFGPDAQKATQIDYMPDQSHMIPFWQSFATTFKNDHALLFDPVTEVAMASWNDPHPNPPGEWACWLNGCTIDSVYTGQSPYPAAGLQSIVDTIRATGATQPIVLGGLDYNADLTQLLQYLPNDPLHQLVASSHIYDFVQGKDVASTFRDQIEPIAKQIPVIIGELGERRCDSGSAAYTKHVLGLVDAEQKKGTVVGVLEWTWNAGGDWHCPTGRYGEGGPLLIRSYNGTPTIMGRVYRNWLVGKR